jgi:hypothetical protein
MSMVLSRQTQTPNLNRLIQGGCVGCLWFYEGKQASNLKTQGKHRHLI